MNVRTAFYNTAPRDVQPRTVYVTKEKLEEIARKESRTEEEVLSRAAQRKIANQIIDYFA